jgi:hypothetical protein
MKRGPAAERSGTNNGDVRFGFHTKQLRITGVENTRRWPDREDASKHSGRVYSMRHEYANQLASLLSTVLQRRIITCRRFIFRARASRRIFARRCCA